MNDTGIGRHLFGSNSAVKESFTTAALGIKTVQMEIGTLESQLTDVRKQMAGYFKELGA